MSFTQNLPYLESKVLTAPPQRLHLMLIEGAQRFGQQAEAALRRGDTEAAAAPLLRLLDVMGELLAGVREKRTELNLKIADFYWFLFRRISQAKINGDAAALTEVLGLLEYERQTWQLVCDKSDGWSSAPASTSLRMPRAVAQPQTTSGIALEA